LNIGELMKSYGGIIFHINDVMIMYILCLNGMEYYSKNTKINICQDHPIFLTSNQILKIQQLLFVL